MSTVWADAIVMMKAPELRCDANDQVSRVGGVFYWERNDVSLRWDTRELGHAQHIKANIVAASVACVSK